MTAFRWTDESVRRALGLRAELAEADVEYARISTDSRTVAEGDLYVALVGERFDGHDFVADALSKGARGAVVSRPAPGDPGGRLYPVEDTLVALGRLAAHRRSRLDAPVVAITGSSGKTTTKDMTAAVLASTLRVHATRGNMNNRVGMPLTLLETPDDVEAIVLELGTNEPGEIATLARIARPDIAVITTVGESHLEKLGSLRGVLDEKLDLLRHMADGGRCVVGDDPDVLAARARALCPRVGVVGWSERADTACRPGTPDVDVFGRYTFTWKDQRVVAPAAGRHIVTDALLALTVADLLGVPSRDAARGLSTTERGGMRGEKRRIGSLTVIVDCYNANPQSVRASLDILEGQVAATKKVVVLGSMLELGEAAGRLHDQVLDDVLRREVNLVVATGHFAEAAERSASARSGRRADVAELLTGESWREVYPALRKRLSGDEIVLLKASRGIALEGILPLLERDFGAGSASASGDAGIRRPDGGDFAGAANGAPDLFGPGAVEV